MNRLLALCTSPDQGGLELYFIKFAKHYGNENKNTMLCKITQHFIKTNLNMRMFGQSLYDQIHFPVMFV